MSTDLAVFDSALPSYLKELVLDAQPDERLRPRVIIG